MQQQLPPGFRFNPTDEQLIANYLQKKVLGEQLPSDAVIEGEVDGDDVQLPEGNGDVKEKYIFAKKKKKNRKGTKMIRTTKTGYWKDNGCTKNILDKSGNHIIGTKRSLTFIDRSSSERKKRLLIDEYGLVGSKIQKNSEEWVLCRIKQRNKSPEIPVSQEGEDDWSTSSDTEIIEKLPIEQNPFENIAGGASYPKLDDPLFHQSWDMDEFWKIINPTNPVLLAVGSSGVDDPRFHQSWDMDGFRTSIEPIPVEIAVGLSNLQPDPPSDQSLNMMCGQTSTMAVTWDDNAVEDWINS